MPQDPFAPQERLIEVAAREHFTGRENYIAAFITHLDADSSASLRVMMFHGVGGIGKTSLMQRLSKDLREQKPMLPFARFNLEDVADPAQAYRQVLLRFRADLERDYHNDFPRFDLCLAVMLEREGGSPPSLVRENPHLYDVFQFVTAVASAPRDGLGRLVTNLARKKPRLEAWLRWAGGTEEVLRLRDRARQDEKTLPEELIRRFAQDLGENLPQRPGKACREVLFLDTYEALWGGREHISAQARLLDQWARDLAGYCLHPKVGVLLVITGRDLPLWEDGPTTRWQSEQLLEAHLMGGLSTRDAHHLLAKCGIGDFPANAALSPLQAVILQCCNTQHDPGKEPSCHPLYVCLCAEIVINTRNAGLPDPAPDSFLGIPPEQAASELANRFLKSLHNSAMELWITELALTPRFDEASALALDAERQHYNGRAGWDQLLHYSFVERQPDGLFYRIHKVMREVLRVSVAGEQTMKVNQRKVNQRKVHHWFREYWNAQQQPALAWYHEWTLDPTAALAVWSTQHHIALKQRRISDARHLLTWWAEIALDDADRETIGRELWADTHWQLAIALVDTPDLARSALLSSAIAHCEAALSVRTETDFPLEWAAIQHYLSNPYRDLPTGDRGQNIRRAIAYCEAALHVYTEADYPMNWALTQNILGNAYWSLPTGDRGQNIEQAIGYYEAALRVRTEADYPMEWAATQHNLGNAYCDLMTGDRSQNLRRAIGSYEAALRVYTEVDYPMNWALTQNNLALAHEDAGERVSARLAMQRAAVGYRQVGMVTEADGAEAWLRDHE